MTSEPQQTTLQQSWEACREELKRTMPAPLYVSLISPIALDTERSNGDPERLYLHVPDEKLRSHIEKTYLKTIEDILSRRSLQRQVSLFTGTSHATAGNDQIGAGSSPANRQLALKRSQSTLTPESMRTTPATASEPQQTASDSQHNIYYTEAGSEDILRTLEQLELHSPAFFLFGSSGTGKTTLLKHLQNHWARAGISHRYFNMESFLTEFSSAITSKDTISWRKKLREHRVIIIDDFQFMKASARKSQEEIRTTLDSFQQTGNRVLIASDIPLEKLTLQEDLRSRLQTSDSLQLNGPDYQARLRILDDLALELFNTTQHKQPSDRKARQKALAYLARQISGDGRRLKSALLRLRQNRLDPENLPEDFQDRMDGLLSDLYTRKSDISPQTVVESVAAWFRLEEAGIQGPARDKKYSLARHLIAYICSEYLEMKLVDTARVIGRRDHATVIHARQKIEKMMAEDLYFKKEVQAIVQELSRGG